MVVDFRCLDRAQELLGPLLSQDSIEFSTVGLDASCDITITLPSRSEPANDMHEAYDVIYRGQTHWGAYRYIIDHLVAEVREDERAKFRTDILLASAAAEVQGSLFISESRRLIRERVKRGRNYFSVQVVTPAEAVPLIALFLRNRNACWSYRRRWKRTPLETFYNEASAEAIPNVTMLSRLALGSRPVPPLTSGDLPAYVYGYEAQSLESRIVHRLSCVLRSRDRVLCASIVTPSFEHISLLCFEMECFLVHLSGLLDILGEVAWESFGQEVKNKSRWDWSDERCLQACVQYLGLSYSEIGRWRATANIIAKLRNRIHATPLAAASTRSQGGHVEGISLLVPPEGRAAVKSFFRVVKPDVPLSQGARGEMLFPWPLSELLLACTLEIAENLSSAMLSRNGPSSPLPEDPSSRDITSCASIAGIQPTSYVGGQCNHLIRYS